MPYESEPTQKKCSLLRLILEGIVQAAAAVLGGYLGYSCACFNAASKGGGGDLSGLRAIPAAYFGILFFVPLGAILCFLWATLILHAMREHPSGEAPETKKQL